MDEDETGNGNSNGNGHEEGEGFENLHYAPPIRIVRNDLRKMVAELSFAQVRAIVDYYYAAQDRRIAAAGQSRALVKSDEPHAIMDWLVSMDSYAEKIIKSAMDEWSMTTPLGQWSRCAPPGSMVTMAGADTVPIEKLRDGMRVMAYDRHHSNISGVRHEFAHEIKVASRPYFGDLVTVAAGNSSTRTTTEHRWPVQWTPDHSLYITYLMNRGARFRVGWCRLFDKTNGFGLTTRMGREQADRGWIIGVHTSKADASSYESYLAAQYGLPLIMFRPADEQYLYTQSLIDSVFDRLNVAEQADRARRLLHDHGRSVSTPLVQARAALVGTGRGMASEPLVVAASNLIPGIVRIARPSGGPGRNGRVNGVEWIDLDDVTRTPYSGTVYSLDVARHHTYIQDGLITHNSITGIGPVIAAGLLAHVQIDKTPTVSALWSYAGLNPEQKWEKGKKRPWNASLKLLTWKAGESFVKVCNNEKDVYGHIYTARKELEIQRNEAGSFSEQAEVGAARVRKTTEAYKSYSTGKLPPAHIHARAKRYAVKRFLADFWSVGYEITYGKPAESPWIIAHGGHTHQDSVPNWPMKVSK